jgi:hypothetical protein
MPFPFPSFLAGRNKSLSKTCTCVHGVHVVLRCIDWLVVHDAQGADDALLLLLPRSRENKE